MSKSYCEGKPHCNPEFCSTAAMQTQPAGTCEGNVCRMLRRCFAAFGEWANEEKSSVCDRCDTWERPAWRQSMNVTASPPSPCFSDRSRPVWANNRGISCDFGGIERWREERGRKKGGGKVRLKEGIREEWTLKYHGRASVLSLAWSLWLAIPGEFLSFNRPLSGLTVFSLVAEWNFSYCNIWWWGLLLCHVFNYAKTKCITGLCTSLTD